MEQLWFLQDKWNGMPEGLTIVLSRPLARASAPRARLRFGTFRRLRNRIRLTSDFFVAFSLRSPFSVCIMSSENRGMFSPPLVSGPESGPDDAATTQGDEPGSYLEAAMK